ncbi:ABC transporter ATP-binding protein [Collinsella ihumii]|uniref:ABC transporter ATP-binding protein n=1 Tax=Collinsella ihumii TaxID=1720204 RepID=A0ABT7XCR6_9ACTN|nr:ABC transporter ATP-binding protein [Collinsella ihumii]MDN0063205.1 ABC transporter ATP-binding protein [Collinsella ihumii]
MNDSALTTPTPSSLPVLSVEHFQKRYGDTVAVRDLSLSVEAGDIYGFIGHNGAGKTTLIRSIVGAQAIDGGRIRICGHDVARKPLQAKSALAYVPDNPDVYEFMTGMQYLTFMADIFRVPDDERTRRIGELAERLELTDALGDTVGTYSHGMRQKLVLIGALIHEPRLLVLDEPFVGLDPVASHELKAILHELAARGGAVFFSSHVLEVVEKLCNKVAIIRGGELLTSGTTEQVRGDSSLEDVFLELVEKEA